MAKSTNDKLDDIETWLNERGREHVEKDGDNLGINFLMLVDDHGSRLKVLLTIHRQRVILEAQYAEKKDLSPNHSYHLLRKNAEVRGAKFSERDGFIWIEAEYIWSDYDQDHNKNSLWDKCFAISELGRGLIDDMLMSLDRPSD